MSFAFWRWNIGYSFRTEARKKVLLPEALMTRKLLRAPEFLRIFYGVAACSWMPHWACHYYRLETHSSFVVGSWSYSSSDSLVSLVVYTSLVILNLIAIQVEKYRVIAAGLSGLGHVGLGALHVYRLMRPFTFEVFGYSWSQMASLREALIVLPFGVFSLIVAAEQASLPVAERH